MVRGTLWGPPIWQCLFACAFHCSDENFKHLFELIMVQLPLLLPCVTCRQHFAVHMPAVTRRARGEPKTPEHAFEWLYYLKDEVNRSLKHPSIRKADFELRFRMHAGALDDVALGDALVYFAMDARERNADDLYMHMCHTLALLLPLPTDSLLLRELSKMDRHVVANTIRGARAARVERGLQELTHAHYKDIVSQDALRAKR